MRAIAAVVLLPFIATAIAAGARASESPPYGCYISTGDNHWLGSSLPIDSPASIEASFDLLNRLGMRRIYWRGLEEATWLETMLVRDENPRYASFWRHIRQLYRDVDPDRRAVEAARRHGMKIYGVGTLVDWGSQADTPCFGDFPHNSESRLRIEHPEWVPVDRSGLLRQGGPIEFAYPAARKALVDLHMKVVRRDGYDGVIFLTYAENYSMRFQDEFGFSPPIMEDFKRRTGVDPRKQPFTRVASKYDWYALRGEYLTAYLRELKAELARDGRILGLFVNPQQPHFPQPWNVPELMLTAGRIYCDLETWVRDGIVDQLLVYGYCHPDSQNRTVNDCLWMARQTPVETIALTSSPFADRWKPFQKQGMPVVLSVNDDEAYLNRSNLAEQPLDALSSDDPLMRMRVLSQIAIGKTKAPAARVVPLVADKNLIVARLALSALGKLKDPQSVPVQEEALSHGENCIRCAAATSLRENNRPQTAARLLAAIERFGNHPLSEIVGPALARIRPAPRAELKTAAAHLNPLVRVVAMRALSLLPDESMVPTCQKALHDPERHVRFLAALGLGNLPRSRAAVNVLLAALEHADPVVSDRAATSLGQIAARKFSEVADLRSAMIAGLQALYAKLGEGCARVDAEWGYRPVGNALLKFGPEGEKVLEAFRTQTADRRLAFLAWKTLCIRQDNGTFSEVTEKENDEAFRHLPAGAK